MKFVKLRRVRQLFLTAMAATVPLLLTVTLFGKVLFFQKIDLLFAPVAFVRKYMYINFVTYVCRPTCVIVCEGIFLAKKTSSKTRSLLIEVGYENTSSEVKSALYDSKKKGKNVVVPMYTFQARKTLKCAFLKKNKLHQ